MMGSVFFIGTIITNIAYGCTGQYTVVLQAPKYAVLQSSYELTCTVEPNVVGVDLFRSSSSGRTSVGQIGTAGCKAYSGQPRYNYTCGTQTTERGEYIFTILNVSLSDDGVTMRCLTVNTNLSFSSNNITISIAVPPLQIFIPYTTDVNGSFYINAMESKPITLTCASQGGRPMAEVTLMTNRRNLTSNLYAVSYTFTPTWENHQQNYSCIASNIALVTPLVRTFQLHVMFEPKLLSILPNISAVEGNKDIKLTCPNIQANPLTGLTYNWTKSGVQIGTAQKLIIDNVSRSNAGQYTCRITNSVGTSDPSSMFLNVLYPSDVKDLQLNGSSTVQENSSVGMKCLVDSNPLSKVVWFNLDTQSNLKTDINVTQSDFTLPATTCMDSGQYTCSAYNGIGGSSNRTLQLQILCAPKLFELDKIADSLSIELGTEIELSLTIISNPSPAIKWFHTASNTNISKPVLFASAEIQNSGVVYSAKLKKDIASKADLGLYTASVMNIHGSIEHTFGVFEKSHKEATTLRDSTTLSTGSIALFVVGTLLCIVGIIFFSTTMIFRRRKKNPRSNKGEDNMGHESHVYDGLNTLQVNTAGNTYDEIRVNETVAGNS